MIRAFVVAAALALHVGLNGAQAAEIFGTWQGGWTVTEKFIGNNVPFGTPPAEPVAMQMTLHALDPVTQDYGSVSFAGTSGDYILTGNVVSLMSDADALNLTIFYPAEGNPTGYGDIVASISGDLMQGSFNERAPAGPGWFHYRGTIALTRVVPEPSTPLLLAMGMGGLSIRSFRRRDGGRFAGATSAMKLS